MKMGRFNPYCYWSYLLTCYRNEIIELLENEFQSLLLLVLSFNVVIMVGLVMFLIGFSSFNPYCYWSYLLTKRKKEI
mgnify:CR=1 FL=1